ncbi:MAG: patatin-like phospholipase family protein [Clostridia bacterium]|nr:patatin-like phospholipase family protein [Clostridia bacterium]
MKKTLGIALGAGGSRGVAHIGFLQALAEEGIAPDYIAGSSMGAVVGAATAAGVPLEEMKHAVMKLRLLHLIAPTGKRGGFFDTTKVKKLLVKYIGELEFSELKIPFRCVAVDMITQSVVEFSDGPLLDGVIASLSIPSIFRPLEKDGMRLIDGGVLERVPVKRVKAMGADVVVAVDVLGGRKSKEKMPGTIGVLLETMDIMDNRRTESQRKECADCIDFWLEPALEDMSQYSLKQVQFAYEKGYELGKAHVDKIKKALRR